MISITLKTNSSLYISNTIMRALISSNLNDNYGLVKVIEENSSFDISNV